MKTTICYEPEEVLSVYYLSVSPILFIYISVWLGIKRCVIILLLLLHSSQWHHYAILLFCNNPSVATTYVADKKEQNVNISSL